MKTLALISGVAFSIFIVRGQSPDLVEFDVASVKPAISRPTPLETMLGRDTDDDKGFDGGPGTKEPDRINYHDVTLRALLARAYDMKAFQISGPGWLATERYVILANVPHGTGAERLRLMLQKLLKDRFQLSIHREARVFPIYQLTKAPTGPKLKPVAAEELPVYKDEEERRAAVRARLKAMLETSKAELEKPDRGRNGAGFTLFRATTAELAQKLSSRLDRPVVDMTQMQGLYNFTLTWAEETAQPPAADSQAPSGPSIFAAIQDRLGLKLVAGKREFNVLVIDGALKIPTSN